MQHAKQRVPLTALSGATTYTHMTVKKRKCIAHTSQVEWYCYKTEGGIRQVDHLVQPRLPPYICTES